MSDFLVWALTGFFLLLLSFSVYVVYSGLLTKIHISTGSSPVKSITVAYKYREGPYRESGLLRAESCKIAPELPTVGVFYDDPKKVPGPECRCAVGSILSEGDQRPSAELQELYEKLGFRIFTFPEVTHVVSSCFPYRTRLSIILGVYRVYPQLACYIKDRKLCAHPFLEIYRNRLIYYMSPLARQGDFYVPEVQKPERQEEWEESEEDRQTDITGVLPTLDRKLCAHPFLEIYRNRLIYYMSPLARQGDFYVPEVQKAPKRQEEWEESEEDRQTDITGADSHRECSSSSRRLQSHSRDTSPALSHQRRDSASDSDSGSRRSRTSSSASSFEELQLEAEKGVTSDGLAHPKVSSQHRGLVVEGEE
ncbi:testis-expressed protein 264 homolog [Silurus meridionalis]|uniref:testis-expressed protein 264 homolog n=1 Tax=Silurus meridionalis TaxID=175797 RepID=UPI001EEA69BF|nr:testis-expressed protein 264 homolog [Silurus meridionalis]